jgi:hypothetical protein
MNSDGRNLAGAFAVVSICLHAGFSQAQPFHAEPIPPDHDLWMYPYGSSNGTRPSAPLFSTFGVGSGVDTRHGQFVLGWKTGRVIPTGAGVTRYLIRSARLKVEVVRNNSFIHDPTPDAFETTLSQELPGAIPDTDSGRPIELFGVGFRGGFTPETFTSTSPFGSASAGGRNAYAAGYHPSGEWVDVGNNVGKSNTEFPSFPTRPFAVGVAQGIEPGEPVPEGTRIEFETDLTDELVLGYLRQGLHTGHLWFALTWLGASNGFGGQPNYPEIATLENLVFNPPQLLIDGVVVRAEDSDNDGLPDDWERFHFGDLSMGPDADPDRDGVDAMEEWVSGASPIRVDALRVVQELTPDRRVLLSWPLVANRKHSVKVASGLNDWIAAEGTFDFTVSGEVRWISAAPATDECRFFRVHAGPAGK